MQAVFSDDDPLKRTELERAEEERRAKGGRPAKLVPDDRTLNQLRGMALIACTQKEAAQILGVTDRAFMMFLSTYSAAREAWNDGSANGKQSLRRLQYANAQAGNVTMQIWLGKNWLGQSDNHQHHLTVSVPDPLREGATTQQAAERYSDIAQLPPSLRLIAPPKDNIIDIDPDDVVEVIADAEMPAPSDDNAA